MTAPQYPAGPPSQEAFYDSKRRGELIAALESAPTALRNAVARLTDAQLDTRYKNWTVRQIVHHIADSHLNSYIRFRWTLTEDQPTIKAYFEDRWSDLPDARTGEVGPSLTLLEGLHARWVLLLRRMSEAQYNRSFVHPESGRTISLHEALGYYAWHGRHHTGQIVWLRDRHGW